MDGIEITVLRYAMKRPEINALCDGVDCNGERAFYFIVGQDGWSDVTEQNLNTLEQRLKKQYRGTRFYLIQDNVDKSDTIEDPYYGNMIWERAEFF